MYFVIFFTYCYKKIYTFFIYTKYALLLKIYTYLMKFFYTKYKIAFLCNS